MKKRIGITAIAVTMVLVFLLVWNYIYKKALLIDNFESDLYAVMISYPDGEGNYIPCTIVEEEIVKEFYHSIESSKIRKVEHVTQDEKPFSDGPTIILYFVDPSAKNDYSEQEYLNYTYKEVLHADSDVTSQYEYGWRKYGWDDTMILFTNQELFTLMEKYAKKKAD